MTTLSYYDTWVATPSGAISSRVYRQLTFTRSAVRTTPQWKQRLTNPNVFVPPTPFSASFSEVKKGYYRYVDINGSGGYGVSNSNYTNQTEPSVPWSSLDAKAITDALNNLKNQKINLAQAFAERAQTAGLVADTAIKFATGIRRLRKGDIRGFADALGFSTRKRFRGVQNSWLELQYGWKPLLSDVYGAVSALEDRDKDYPQRYRIGVKGSGSFHWRDNSTRITDGGRRSVTCQRRADAGSRVWLYYYIQNPALASAASSGITNPAQLAWELIPYSFVVDWFLPIGNYLSSFDADLGCVFIGGCKTQRYEYFDNELHIGLTPTGSALYKSFFHGPQSLYKKTVNRVTYVESPVPRFPGFKNPFSLHHLANALSLLKSSVR